MYLEYFELKYRPFPQQVDLDSYFASPSHESALAQFGNVPRYGEGLALLLGQSGLGKTLVAHRLVRELGDNLATVYLAHNSFKDLRAFHQAILFDLGVPYEPGSDDEIRQRLIDAITRQFAEGQRTVLLIDEAHRLSPALLEESRLLTNLEGRKDRALQIMFFADEGHESLFRHADLTLFRQRVGLVGRLERFDDETICDYIRKRMTAAGGDCDSIFSATALAAVCERSGGIPRRVNQLCHRALMAAYLRESGTVDSRDVNTAAALLYWDEQEPCHSHHAITPIDRPAAPRSQADPYAPHHETDSPFIEIGAGSTEPRPASGPRFANFPALDEPTIVEPDASEPSPPAPPAEKPLKLSTRSRRLFGI